MGYEIRSSIKAPQHPHLTAKQIQALGGVDVKFRDKRPRPTLQVEAAPEPVVVEPVSAPKPKSKSPV